MTADEKYMLIALQLAARGLGQVEPNPVVGAIIVRNGRIIGRGWHKKFGGPHAEINALADCRKRHANPGGATMFVTLEPCCHYGKTGPCTGSLIDAGLARVVVATIDPSQHCRGRGIRQLRKAGIKVDVGLCENQARLLNAPFLKFAETAKPWVTLKWAQSADRFLARTDNKRWISNPKSRADAHKLRKRVAAVLVGINTVLKDNPLLTSRPAGGKKPLRIILDNRLRIPLDCRLLASAKSVPVLVVTRNKMLRTAKAKQIIGRGAEIIASPVKTGSDLRFLLNHLGKCGIRHLLVEGGPSVIASFLKAKLADEIIIYVSPEILADKGAAGIGKAVGKVGLYRPQLVRIGDNIRIRGLTHKL